jgi:hypothetical protein
MTWGVMFDKNMKNNSKKASTFGKDRFKISLNFSLAAGVRNFNIGLGVVNDISK